MSADATELQIRREALAGGMQTLLLTTLRKVHAGRTTLSELFRVIELDEVDTGAADQCPSCGTVTESDYLACPACACRLAPACPLCDRKVMEHWKACPYCCTRLNQPVPDGKEVPAMRAHKLVRKPAAPPALAAAK